jgi:Site-specific recombinases, DNA invertase Pin homologs
MRAALYIRVSTDEQAREGFSIDAQKRKLLAYAESQDWDVVSVLVDDGYSAKDLNRPAMQELLQKVRNEEIDVVLVFKLDRLTRSVRDLYALLDEFSRHDVGFRSAQEQFDTTTTMGRAMLGILGIFAQWERETIAERVRFGMEQKVREGKKPGGKYPFGYDRKGNLIPDEAEIIRRVRELYMKENLSFLKIAERLNSEGKLRRGHEWTRNTVALTLENPFYAGIIRFGSKMKNGKYPQRKRDLRVDVIDVPGDHEQVWTKEEYDEHLRLMRMRSVGNNSRKLDYIFSGLLRCGRCGSTMFGRLTTKRNRKSGEIVRTPYYFCGKRKDNNGCDMPMFRQVHVEHLIMKYIESIRLDRSKIELKQDRTELNKKIRLVNNELNRIRERRKRWQYMYVNELISEVDLRRNLNEEKEQEEKLLGELRGLENQKKEEFEYPARLLEIVDVWDQIDNQQKRELVWAIFDEITLHTNESNVKGVKNKFFPAWVEIRYR